MLDVQSLHNPVDDILAFLTEQWPELLSIPGVWLSGGHVWRRLLGKPVEEAKDVDLFCTNTKSMEKVETLLALLTLTNDTVIAPSVGPLGGEVWFTSRGRVDLWTCQSAQGALKAYSDIKEHARVAFNIKARTLLWLPSKVERKPGDRFIRFQEAVGEGGPRLEWVISE